MGKPNINDSEYLSSDGYILSWKYMEDLENYADELLKQNKQLREAWVQVNGLEAWITDPEMKRMFIKLKNQALKP